MTMPCSSSASAGSWSLQLPSYVLIALASFGLVPMWAGSATVALPWSILILVAPCASVGVCLGSLRGWPRSPDSQPAGRH